MAFPSTDLIAYWKLDEASGTRADSAAGGAGDHSLFIDSGAGLSSAAGKIGLAAQFDNTSSSAQWHAANSTDLNPVSFGGTSFTVAGWINVADIGFGIVGSGTMASATNDSFGGVYVIGVGPDFATQKIGFTIFDTGGTEHDFFATTFGSVTSGVWYFIVASWDSALSQVTISVNDTADTYSYSGGFFPISATFALGNSFELTGWQLNGLVDEVGFWSRVLTPTERTTLYNAGAGLTYTPSPPPPPPPPPPPSPPGGPIQMLNLIVDPAATALLTDDGVDGQSPPIPGGYWNVGNGGVLNPRTGEYVRPGGSGTANQTRRSAPFAWRDAGQISTAQVDVITEVMFNPIGGGLVAAGPGFDNPPVQIQTGTLIIVCITITDPNDVGFSLDISATAITDDLGTAYQFVRQADLSGDVRGRLYVFYGIAPGPTATQTKLTINPPFSVGMGDTMILDVTVMGYTGYKTSVGSVSSSGSGNASSGGLSMTPGIVPSPGAGAMIFAAYTAAAQAVFGGSPPPGWEIALPGPTTSARFRNDFTNYGLTPSELKQSSGEGGFQTDVVSFSTATAPSLQLISTHTTDTQYNQILFWTAIGVAFVP